MKRAAVVLALLAGTLFLPSPGFADDSDARVARVGYVGGEVSYQRGDVEGWNGLRVNTPLVSGDSLFAAAGGRAEADLGNGVVVRLDGGTLVDLVNNTRNVAQLGMRSGALDLRARSFPQGFTVEIDTPNAAATILEPGHYRVQFADRAVRYEVVQGAMSLAVGGQQLDVREGESLEIEDADPPTYAYGTLAGRTPFQSWCDGRDSRFERSPSAQYVNADVVGYEDLDDYGSWRESPEYGRVWTPRMAEGWAPYQSGRWIWQDPFGWTWVSDESWGWAPYHYGRWAWTGNYWGWVPPPRRGYRGPAAVMGIEAVYAPALVAFVGGRNWGASLSIGGPAIGWVPLAPSERYYYPWQSAPREAGRYRNIAVNNAVTVVNYNAFGAGAVRPIRVARTEIARAPVIGSTAVGVAPRRESLVVAPGRSAGAKAVPRVVADRPLAARLVPPPRPQPFAQKAAEIERTGRPAPRPAAIEGPVGKPFVAGVRAPAGVKAVSALAPEAPKELKPRSGAVVRPPKKIERDIAPPPSARRGAGPAPVPKTVAPAPAKREAPPARGERQAPPAARPTERPEEKK